MGTIMPAGFAIGVNEKEQVAKEERRNEWTKTRRTASRARTRKPACSLTLLKVGETTRSLPRCRSSRSMVEQAAPRHLNFHLSPHGQKWQAKRGGGERRQSPFNLRPGQRVSERVYLRSSNRSQCAPMCAFCGGGSTSDLEASKWTLCCASAQPRPPPRKWGLSDMAASSIARRRPATNPSPPSGEVVKHDRASGESARRS